MKILSKKFSTITKQVFGKDIKILDGYCNRVGGCGGSGGCNSSMYIHLNSYCNASCYFCVSDHKNTEISNFIKLESLIDELISKEVISKVAITGGEPTMYPRFTELLDMLDTKTLKWYSLNTNGILLHKYIDHINKSKLKHINISLHHYNDTINREIMGNCVTKNQIKELREVISNNIEIRLACTITDDLNSTSDIIKYIEMAKSLNINNVIFRAEYTEVNKNVNDFKNMWGDMFTADICSCSVLDFNGVKAEFREANIKLKELICENDLYLRDFIYKDDDILSGSWEYGSQPIY